MVAISLVPYTTLFRSIGYAVKADALARIHTVGGRVFVHGQQLREGDYTRIRIDAGGEGQGTGRIANVPFNGVAVEHEDRKSTRLSSSHTVISYAVSCL